jgi:cob(I)alamin adenosyltransferase
MKVTTKAGDKGQTKFRGAMLDKSSPVFELLGGLDEIQAAIAVAYETNDFYDHYLYDVMKDLYTIMGDIYLNRIPSVIEGAIKIMEFVIVERTESFPQRFNRFVLPIQSIYIAQLNYARTVVRRVERFFIGLAEEIEINIHLRDEIGKYLNRLSDFLYVLATSLQD